MQRPVPDRGMKYHAWSLVLLLLGMLGATRYDTACGPFVEYSLCAVEYPVAAGGHGNHYDALVEVVVLDSSDPGLRDATFVGEAELYTVDELAPGAERQWQGVLHLSISIEGQPLCPLFELPPEQGHMVELDGSANSLTCGFGYPFGRGSELTLWNLSPLPKDAPRLEQAILQGVYTTGATERYLVKIYGLSGPRFIPCYSMGAANPE